MNLEREFANVGFYEPVFLHLRVNTEIEITDLNYLYNNESLRAEFSTFLHEYIHFLQNITTTVGLTTSSFYINNIKEANLIVRNLTQNEFDLPFKPDNKNNILANISLQSLYRGDKNETNYLMYSHYLEETEDIFTRENSILSVRKYKVFYLNHDTKNEESIYFGYECLKEYVASFIQKKFYPLNTQKYPDIPYCLAELILQKEIPEFAQDQLNILALCDACLMVYHPASVFFKTIELIKIRKFVPKIPEDVYELIYNNFTLEYGDQKETIDSLFEKSYKMAIEQYIDTLKSPIFEPNREWLKCILEEGMVLRKSNPAFILQIVEEEGKLSNLFFEIVKKIGTPFFTNKNESGGFIPPKKLSELTDILPHHLLVYREFINLVFKGQISCGLFDFCNISSNGEIVNENCINAPWLRGTEEELCPFGQIWKAWGLNGKTPRIK